jgi:hypothetical protein
MFLLSLLTNLSVGHALDVLVIDGNSKFSSFAAVADQLEDSKAYSFNVTVLTPDDIVSVSDLTPYDAVLMGDSGYNDFDLYSSAFIGLLEDYQTAGGGVIYSSWSAYLASDISTVSPISGRDASYCTGPTTLSVESSHEITTGVSSTFTDSSSYTESPGIIHKDAEILVSADCNGNGAVIVREISGTRQVYLGSLYFGSGASYNNTSLRSGDADTILEQATAWVAGCTDNDKDGVTDCASDCDDSDPNNFPGNVELCDGFDNDCDGMLDSEEYDADKDGFAPCQGDCDDSDSTTNPDAIEECDGVDNDCDTVIPGDELDGDEDGFAACAGDCDDTDAGLFPGNVEVCDDIDNNCDGNIDDGLDFFSVYTDTDGDGYGDDATATEVCAQPSGAVLEGGDCDDTDATASPAGTEVADNGVDEDCDGADLISEDEGEEDKGGACAHASPGHALSLVLLGGLVALSRRRGQLHR